MTELQTSFPLENQPTLLDLMQQSQRVTGLKNLNLGADRQFQSEDAKAAKMAQLAQIRSQFTNPQTGQVDRAGYQGALNMSGMGLEADADQTGQYEMQQKKLESTVKAIDFSSRILGAAADHPEYRQQAVDLVYKISESIGGKKPDITADDPPEKFQYFAAQGLSYKDKLQMDFEKSKEQRQQGNFDARLAETKRGNDIQQQVGMGANSVAGGKQMFEAEQKMNADHRAESKTFIDVRDAYSRLMSALPNAHESSPATLAAGTTFMKLLDPGSVVRESELGMALNATGKLDKALNYAHSLAAGQTLTESQVKEFGETAKQLFDAAKKNQDLINTQYNERSKQYGMNPDHVVTDYTKNMNVTSPRLYDDEDMNDPYFKEYLQVIGR